MTAFVPPYSPSLPDWQRQVSLALNPALAKVEEFELVSAYATGDGATDDTTGLTNFFNHAIQNPGVRHILDAKTYCFSAALPTINVPNVWIEGVANEIHDGGTGPQLSGTVLKWIGGAAHSTIGLSIEPLSGASVQRLSGIVFRGIGFDCNSGALGTGLSVKSVRNSVFDVAAINGFVAGVSLGCVSTLGEGADLQHNQIKVLGRQIEATTGNILIADGSATANTSANLIKIVGQFTNVPGVKCVNTDNNRFHVELFFAGGSATYGMEMLGGSGAMLSRSDIIDFYSSGKPIKVYGTEAYTAPSHGHIVNRLDIENSTPVPIVGTGASIAVRNGIQTYTPTITASSGTITTSSATMNYLLDDAGVIHYWLAITITTNGTGAGALQFSLPFAAAAGLGFTAAAVERALVPGKAVTVDIPAAASVANLHFADGTYPAANGSVFAVTGTYRMANF